MLWLAATPSIMEDLLQEVRVFAPALSLSPLFPNVPCLTPSTNPPTPPPPAKNQPRPQPPPPNLRIPRQPAPARSRREGDPAPARLDPLDDAGREAAAARAGDQVRDPASPRAARGAGHLRLGPGLLPGPGGLGPAALAAGVRARADARAAARRRRLGGQGGLRRGQGRQLAVPPVRGGAPPVHWREVRVRPAADDRGERGEAVQVCRGGWDGGQGGRHGLCVLVLEAAGAGEYTLGEAVRVDG